MSERIHSIPEPFLPEHQLLREAGPLPTLSSGLRDRVVTNVHKQVRNGRWADRLRLVASVLAACLLVGVVWHFRWTGQEQVVRKSPVEQTRPVTAPMAPSSSNYAETPSKDTPKAHSSPEGGAMALPNMKELQQLNRLIEDIQGRNNVLCGLLEIQ